VGLLALDYRTVTPFIVWPLVALWFFLVIRRYVIRRGERDSAPPIVEPIAPPPIVEATPPIVEPIAPPPIVAPAPPPVEVAPPVPAAAPDLPPPVRPPTGTPGRSIFDPPAPTEADLPTSRRPIAELVEGIRMPCDLAPIMETVPRVGAREEVAFVTRGHSATEVGGAVGDELRRLGYELQARAETEALAVRGDDVLGVTVYPEPWMVERAGRPAFPVAIEGSVVVELWTD
jgi:hypothetical protein